MSFPARAVAQVLVFAAFTACRAAPDGPAPASAGRTAGTPVPFDTLRELHLQKEQGGPSIRHCSGIDMEVDVDLARNAWSRGLCLPAGNQGTGNEPLSSISGKLSPDKRARIAAEYAKLTIAPATGCGKDGGTITIRATPNQGPVVRYVDENWGCKSPPPIAAKGAQEFMMFLLSILPT